MYGSTHCLQKIEHYFPKYISRLSTNDWSPLPRIQSDFHWRIPQTGNRGGWIGIHILVSFNYWQYSKEQKIYRKQKNSKILIITDFLSAIQKIASTTIRLMDTVTVFIKMLIHGLTDNYIIFLWVPSHLGMRGNEVADTVARIGRDLRIPYSHNVNGLDFFPWIKTLMHTFLGSGKASRITRRPFTARSNKPFHYSPGFPNLPSQIDVILTSS